MSPMPCANTLVLTSSFPRYAGDYAGCFVAEHAALYRNLGEVQILAPADALVDPGFQPLELQVTRFAPRYEDRPGPFYGAGGPENMKQLERLLEAPYAALAMLAKAHELAPNAGRIVSHWIAPAGVVGATLRRPDRPHQLIVHGGAFHLLKRTRSGRALIRWVLERTDDIVVVASCLKRELLDVLGVAQRPYWEPRIRVLPMGLEVSRFERPMMPSAAQSECRPTVSVVGRLVPIKGMDRLVRALEGSEARLQVVGDGPESRRLQRMCIRAGLDATFHGMLNQSHLVDLYHRTDILALPSRNLSQRHEGVPRVLMEGMAAGVAVAATDTGGIGDLVQHERNGLLDSGNIEQLRENLQRLIGQPEFRRSLGERAHRDIRRLDWNRQQPLWLSPFEGAQAV